jgi:predicted nucleic acid-binding protein
VLRPIAFWDASVLVPLCVIQPQTVQAVSFFSSYRVSVWWATRVEMTSAFVRLLRSQEIDSQTYAQAQLEAERYANRWHVVEPSARIALNARAVLEHYPLRAADALQLTAAMELCEGKPQGNVFLTFDKRLQAAAGLAGFTLE